MQHQRHHSTSAAKHSYLKIKRIRHVTTQPYYRPIPTAPKDFDMKARENTVTKFSIINLGKYRRKKFGFLSASRSHPNGFINGNEAQQRIETSMSSTSGPHELRADQTTSSEIKPLTHLTSSGSAHMVNISHKTPSSRAAVAVSTLLFSEPSTYDSLLSARIRKGDALAIVRIAGIQAAKKTADLIPLAHPALNITGITIDVEPFLSSNSSTAGADQLPDLHGADPATNKFGGVLIIARVECEGKTGVEMEALTAATVGSLTMYDMLKGIDKGMVIVGTRVVEKKGGKSGDWKWDPARSRVVRDKKPKENIASVQTPSPSAPMPSPEFMVLDIDEWNQGLSEEFSSPPINDKEKTDPQPSTHDPSNANITTTIPPSSSPAEPSSTILPRIHKIPYPRLPTDEPTQTATKAIALSRSKLPRLESANTSSSYIYAAPHLPEPDAEHQTTSTDQEGDALTIRREMLSGRASEMVDARGFESWRVRRWKEWMESS